MITQERQHGDITEHLHDGYEYWHPITRIHKESNLNDLPADHVLAPVIQYSEAQETPRGLQVQSFDWKTWDAGCHAKGICQGYHSIPQNIEEEVVEMDKYNTHKDGSPIGIIVGHRTVLNEPFGLHHRSVAPDLQGIAEQYWQCPHCRKLQKPIQWAQRARLETYHIEQRRRGQTILWLKISSGQWFVLVLNTRITVQRLASEPIICSSYQTDNGLHTYQGGNIALGTAYAVGNYPPQQMPDEIAVTLARRFWHRITKGYWSDRPTENEE